MGVNAPVLALMLKPLLALNTPPLVVMLLGKMGFVPTHTVVGL